MFYAVHLTHTIKLHPSFFGPNVRQFIRQKLLQDVEGKCDGEYGYVLCVLDDENVEIPPGKIIPGQGMAEFTVMYRALVWKPFKVCFHSFWIESADRELTLAPCHHRERSSMPS